MPLFGPQKVRGGLDWGVFYRFGVIFTTQSAFLGASLVGTFQNLAFGFSVYTRGGVPLGGLSLILTPE